MNRTILLTISAVLLAGPSIADTIYLNSGATYNGHFMGERDARVAFQDGQNVQYQFPIRDMQSMSFSRSGVTVVLRSGKTYFGAIMGPLANTISWIDGRGVSYQFPTYQVSSITFTEGWRYVNCGHPSPVLVRADGSLELLDATATVLGAFQDRGFEERQVLLSPGDRLVVFSDGFSEARMDQESDDWAVQTIRTMSPKYRNGLAGALASAATGFGKQADDITVMDIRLT